MGGKTVRRAPTLDDLRKELNKAFGFDPDNPDVEAQTFTDPVEENRNRILIEALQMAIATKERERLGSPRAKSGRTRQRLREMEKPLIPSEDFEKLRERRATQAGREAQTAAQEVPFPLEPVPEDLYAGTKEYGEYVESRGLKLAASDISDAALRRLEDTIIFRAAGALTPAHRRRDRAELAAVRRAIQHRSARRPARAPSPLIPVPDKLPATGPRKVIRRRGPVDTTALRAMYEDLPTPQLLAIHRGLETQFRKFPDRDVALRANTISDLLRSRRLEQLRKAADIAPIASGKARSAAVAQFVSIEGLKRWEGFSEQQAIRLTARRFRSGTVPEELIARNYAKVKANLSEFVEDIKGEIYEFHDEDRNRHGMTHTGRHLLRADEDWNKLYEDDENLQRGQLETDSEFEERTDRLLSRMQRDLTDADEFRRWLTRSEKPLAGPDPPTLEELSGRSRRYPPFKGFVPADQVGFTSPAPDARDLVLDKNRTRSAVLMHAMTREGMPPYEASLRVMLMLGGTPRRQEFDSGNVDIEAPRVLRIDSPEHLDNWNHPQFRRDRLRAILQGRVGTPEEQRALREVLVELKFDPDTLDIFNREGRVNRGFHDPNKARKAYNEIARKYVPRLREVLKGEMSQYVRTIRPEPPAAPPGEPPKTPDVPQVRDQIARIGGPDIPEDAVPAASEKVSLIATRRLSTEDRLYARKVGYWLAQRGKTAVTGGTTGDMEFVIGVLAGDGRAEIHVQNPQQRQSAIRYLTRVLGSRSQWADRLRWIEVDFDPEEGTGADKAAWNRSALLHPQWKSLSEDARRGTTAYTKAVQEGDSLILFGRPGGNVAQQRAAAFGGAAHAKRVADKSNKSTWDVRQHLAREREAPPIVPQRTSTPPGAPGPDIIDRDPGPEAPPPPEFTPELPEPEEPGPQRTPFRVEDQPDATLRRMLAFRQRLASRQRPGSPERNRNEETIARIQDELTRRQGPKPPGTPETAPRTDETPPPITPQAPARPPQAPEPELPAPTGKYARAATSSLRRIRDNLRRTLERDDQNRRLTPEGRQRVESDLADVNAELRSRGEVEPPPPDPAPGPTSPRPPLTPVGDISPRPPEESPVLDPEPSDYQYDPDREWEILERLSPSELKDHISQLRARGIRTPEQAQRVGQAYEMALRRTPEWGTIQELYSRVRKLDTEGIPKDPVLKARQKLDEKKAREALKTIENKAVKRVLEEHRDLGLPEEGLNAFVPTADVVAHFGPWIRNNPGLAELRGYVGLTDVDIARGAERGQQRLLREISILPKSWLRRLNDSGENVVVLELPGIKGAGWFYSKGAIGNPFRGRSHSIVVPLNARPGTLLHEFVHLMEEVHPGLLPLQGEWLLRKRGDSWANAPQADSLSGWMQSLLGWRVPASNQVLPEDYMQVAYWPPANPGVGRPRGMEVATVAIESLFTHWRPSVGWIHLRADWQEVWHLAMGLLGGLE
jgi:hypothetical protein